MLTSVSPDSSLDLSRATIRILSITELGLISDMNKILFNEDRIINHYDHPDLVILLTEVNGLRAGFKIGYGRNDRTFYSAKGGVMPAFRRHGLARAMTHEMIKIASQLGYSTFEYDTFPNNGHEMLAMGLSDGFKITEAGFNEIHQDIMVHLSVSIPEYLSRHSGPGQNDAG